MPADNLPTDHAARDLVDVLRALSRKPRDPHLARLDAKLIDSVERRMRDALRRDAAGSAAPDGYPRRTDGGGIPSTSSTSRTEAVALDLAEPDHPRRHRDHHHLLTLRAARALEASALHLNTCVAALASLDDLTRDIHPTPHTCSHCTDKRGQNANRPIYATGTVGDRLDRSAALCRSCYGFVEQSAKPATRLGILPTDEQIRWHEERGRWRLHVA